MGFENFGFSPENRDSDLTRATERLADVLREMAPEERALFGNLNRRSNSFLEESK